MGPVELQCSHLCRKSGISSLKHLPRTSLGLLVPSVPAGRFKSAMRKRRRTRRTWALEVGARRSNRASSSQKVGAADGTLSGQSLVVTKGLKPHGAAEGAGHASSGQSRHRNRSWPGKVRGRIRPNRSQLSVAPPGPIIRQVLCFNGVSGVTIIAFSPTAFPLNSQLGSRKPHTSWHETWDSIDAQTELSVASRSNT